jgi:MYXO-CTERM domain-containing protein
MVRSPFALAALLVLAASVAPARAGVMTLSVYAGRDATGPLIYSVSNNFGVASADVADLNSGLVTAGYGAYQFNALTSQGVGVGSLLVVADLSVAAGGAGELEEFTIVASYQDGFELPTHAPSLHDTVRSVSGVTAFGSIYTRGTFTDASGVQVTTPETANTSFIHYASVEAPLGAYSTPFSLEARANVVASSLSRDPSKPGRIRFTQLVSAVPEPSSAAMGAAAVLVGLGVARRRRTPASRGVSPRPA